MIPVVRVGVVGNISACHADAPGSIPGHGAFLGFSAIGRPDCHLFPPDGRSCCFYFRTTCSYILCVSRLAQLVERKTLNLVVVGSSPTVGGSLFAPLRCVLVPDSFKKCANVFGLAPCTADGVLAQSEARVLSKDEVLGSKPRYSIQARMV